MRILLDESLPRRLGRELLGHDAVTVTERGWSGTKNGDLLRLAASEFDVFLTADQNLQYQQNLSTLPLSIIVLIAPDNKLETLCLLVPEVLDHLANLPLRSLVNVGKR
ncbi:MAG: DUF5615 family PIN-like protein [Planctomycetaceae bacterium]